MIFLQPMNKVLHDRIVYGSEFSLINSPAFYECVVHVLCLSGRGEFRYNGELFYMEKDDIAVISMPRNISGIKQDEDFACEYIVAPEEYLHALLPANNYSIVGRVSLFANPIIHADKCQVEKFSNDIRHIAARSVDSGHRFYNEMIGGLFRTMIYDLFDFHLECNGGETITDRVGYVTGRFLAMISDGEPKVHRNPAFYASKLNVSVKYLSETIKRITGISVSQHINHTAASVILELLKDNRLSITQIADEMNFSSVSYFSRFCVKHLGMSPRKFRTVGN